MVTTTLHGWFIRAMSDSGHCYHIVCLLQLGCLALQLDTLCLESVLVTDIGGTESCMARGDVSLVLIG